MATKKTVNQYWGVGRRKTSVARVYLTEGEGKIIVNGVDARSYFPYEILIMDLSQPLVNLGVEAKYDVHVNVRGGGFTGQAGAVRLGVARALLEVEPENEENRKILKKAGLLVRDSRKKERKKPGLKAARRAPQFSKR